MVQFDHQKPNMVVQPFKHKKWEIFKPRTSYVGKFNTIFMGVLV
jgi:hypothetical protein